MRRKSLEATTNTPRATVPTQSPHGTRSNLQKNNFQQKHR
jgi:hypothetical protein